MKMDSCCLRESQSDIESGRQVDAENCVQNICWLSLRIRSVVLGLLCLLCLLMFAGCGSQHMELKKMAPLPAMVHDLHLQEDVLPAELQGTWIRLQDDLRVPVMDNDALRIQQAGAYLFQGHTICLRSSNDAAAYAQSLCGLASSNLRDRELMAVAAWDRRAINPVMLMILSWRLADDWPWPWVNGVSLYGGLSGLCQHWNGNSSAYAFDPTQALHVDHAGQPIRIATSASPAQESVIPGLGVVRTPDMRVILRLGDLIASEDSASGLARYGILVADNGRLGFLDPEDVLVSAFVPPEKQAEKIQQWRIGHLMGPNGLHVYRRDLERAKSIRSRYKPDNPIWNLSPRRQWMVLAGMMIVIVVLMRRGRKLRRKR